LSRCSNSTVPASSNTQYQLDRSPRSNPIVSFCSAEVLLNWRSRSPYKRDPDWVFASPEKSGQQPYWAWRRTAQGCKACYRARAHIGWHTFRHSFATLLKANGEDVKV